MKKRTYFAFDLKSFYASVECVERNLNPLTTNLVVADKERSEKTICLAVTPSLKSYGISGRARLFEVVEQVRAVNALRKKNAPGRTFTGSSTDDTIVKASPGLKLDYITAVPRMGLYMEYSTRIYEEVYLKYFAPEDVIVYSVDEVFIDATCYLSTYKCTPRQLATRIVHEIRRRTGITATGGIGSNLYLCKVAMDIGAKHIQADESGVRIAELDELSYRRSLWSHRPLTDFWRVGRGYAKKLEGVGLFTMGDIARCSLGGPGDYHNEELLYHLFGINAELLIDHAWGHEPCLISDIKAYRPSESSLSSGQVLHAPYSFEKAKLIVQEMTDLLVLDLVDKGLVTDQLVLSIGYEGFKGGEERKRYQGAVTTDPYGRQTPKCAHGSIHLGQHTASTKAIIAAASALMDRIVDPKLMVRRVNITANHILAEADLQKAGCFEQLDFFTNDEATRAAKAAEEEALERERDRQRAVLAITKKFGRNAILKGMNLLDGATTVDRNQQIGGHRA